MSLTATSSLESATRKFFHKENVSTKLNKYKKIFHELDVYHV